MTEMSTVSLNLMKQVCRSFLLSGQIYAGRVACRPLVTRIEYVPHALFTFSLTRSNADVVERVRTRGGGSLKNLALLDRTSSNARFSRQPLALARAFDRVRVPTRSIAFERVRSLP